MALARLRHRQGRRLAGHRLTRRPGRDPAPVPPRSEDILELVSYGLPFLRTPEGKIYRRTSGGQSLEFGEGGQAFGGAAAAVRTGHAILHTRYCMALKFGGLCFVEYMDLIMCVDGRGLGHRDVHGGRL